MNLSQALDKSLKDFGISAKWLSKQSGLSEKMISAFRNSRQRIYSDSLERLIEVLPFEVRLHFFSLLLGGEITPEKLISGMGEAELSSLLIAIADQLSPKEARQPAVPPGDTREKVAS